MAHPRLDKVLVVDFEETCWEGEVPPGQYREIIQWGIAEVTLGADMSISRTGNYYVKPKFPLSAYCQELTGITPMTLRGAAPLPQVCNRVKKEFGVNKVWLAWGKDNLSLERDCQRYGVSSPMVHFMNLGLMWSLLHGKNIGLVDALGSFGESFIGTPHHGDDDAFNTARLFVLMSQRLSRP